MTRDLANLSETMRAIDDIRNDIEKYRRWLNQVKPYGEKEIESIHEIAKKLDNLQILRHALDKRKEELEES